MTHPAPLADWTPPPLPGPDRIEGRYAVLERLSSERHGADLYEANRASDTMWDWLPYGPFSSQAVYHRWLAEQEAKSDPFFYAIADRATGRWLGVQALMRIDAAQGVIELGHVALSPALQRSRIATEAFTLMIDWAFAAGYRRFEWKCNARNIPSRAAAQRLGFSYEGVFRQAAIVKGRNRDTAWFSAIDREWPGLQAAYAAWLDPSNFDATGQQIDRLGNLTGLVLENRDPALG
ncbi:MAG: GNAT family protein [Celeribacter sp.]|jgi:RimJ/RimL family protein N-acetyltransferase